VLQQRKKKVNGDLLIPKTAGGLPRRLFLVDLDGWRGPLPSNQTVFGRYRASRLIVRVFLRVAVEVKEHSYITRESIADARLRVAQCMEFIALDTKQ
jgi:hypothetical protein